MPQITLWFLQASRCIRIAWLLEALGLDYEVKFSERENGVAPAAFKQAAGGLGKFPTLQDGNVTVYESSNIVEYLCDTYDKAHRYLPVPGDPRRYTVLQWVHMSEGTFALHGLAILYARWNQKDGDVAKTEEGMSKNINKDMEYLTAALNKTSGRFIFGDEFNAADICMHFSAVFIIERELGLKKGQYPAVEKYIKDCESTDSYKAAVKKTGHKL